MVTVAREMIGSSKPWIAKITGRDAKYGLARDFLAAAIDYSHANRPRTRGVMYTWQLNDGIYEIKGGSSWGSAGERQFVRIEGEQVSKIEITDVLAALQ